jgi:hypothetical protein
VNTWVIVLIVLLLVVLAFVTAVWVQHRRRAGGIIATRGTRPGRRSRRS